MTKRRAMWLMAALGLAYALWVLVWALGFSAGSGVRVAADPAAPEDLMTGRDDAETSLELLPGEQMDLNAADVRQLQRLPGIGETLARAIVEDRETNGPFATIEDVMRVPGIGEGRFEAIREYITVG